MKESLKELWKLVKALGTMVGCSIVLAVITVIEWIEILVKKITHKKSETHVRWIDAD